MNAIKFGLEMDRKPSRDEILSLAEKWQGYESYATFYFMNWIQIVQIGIIIATEVVKMFDEKNK